MAASHLRVSELFDLSGRVAMVTGGTQNLGRDMAEALGEAGAQVVITSREGAKAVAAAEQLGAQLGRSVLGLPLEVTDEDSVSAAFGRVAEAFGRLDVLVCNAGGARLTSGGVTTAERSADDFDYVARVNLRGTFLCCRAACRLMQPAGRGSIITIGSISGLVGRDRSVYDGSPQMIPNIVDYSAAKGAVIAFTRDLAAEVGRHGIRVNCISPGGFERGQPAEFIRRYSAQTMLGRMGTDGRDLKGAVVFLAAEASSYVTGHNLVVDGGFTAW